MKTGVYLTPLGSISKSGAAEYFGKCIDHYLPCKYSMQLWYDASHNEAMYSGGHGNCTHCVHTSAIL